jgi:hypothetical protein
VDAPADPDIGASVEFAHDAFEDAGGQFGSAFVAEEEPAGVGVADEGEDFRFGGQLSTDR